MLTIPNLLTLLRLLLVPCFLVASMRGLFLTAFVLFVTAAVTDIFDGMIARRLNQRSKLGAILDPAVDKTMMICGYLFYTFGSNVRLRLPGWVMFTVFIRDFSILFFAYLMYTRMNVKRFPPSAYGKASTVLQALALAWNIGVNAFAPSLAWVADILYRVVVVVTLYSGWDYLRRGQRMLVDVPESGA